MKTLTRPPAPPFLDLRTAVSRRQLAGTLVTASVVIVTSSWIAWDGEVPGWEAAVLRFFNGWPDWLEPGMWVLQQVGVFMAPVIAGAIIVSFTRTWWHLLPFVLVLPAKLVIEKAIVKQLVDRERPWVSVGPDIEVRGPAFEGLSFPSGHCTTAFATAVLVAAFLPLRWRWVPIAWAMIVAVARLYYGEHNLLDVLTGAALGVGFATTLWFVILNRGVVEPVEVAS